MNGQSQRKHIVRNTRPGNRFFATACAFGTLFASSCIDAQDAYAQTSEDVQHIIIRNIPFGRRDNSKAPVYQLREPAPGNSCGPNRFQVLNPNKGEAVCVGKGEHEYGDK